MKRIAFRVLFAFAAGGALGWALWRGMPPPPAAPSAAVPQPAPPLLPPAPAPTPPTARPPREAYRPDAFAQALAEVDLALADEAWEAAFGSIRRATQMRPEEPALEAARRRVVEAAARTLRRLRDEAAAGAVGGADAIPAPAVPAAGPGAGAGRDGVFRRFDALAAFVERLPERDPAFRPLVPADLQALQRETESLRARREAEELERMGDWSGAEKAYARVEAAARGWGPRSGELDRARRFTALCARARERVAAGQIDAAIASYRQALELGRRQPLAEAELAALETRRDDEARRERAKAAAAAAETVAEADRAIRRSAWAEADRLLEPLLRSAGASLAPDLQAEAGRLLRTARLGGLTPAGMVFVTAGPFLMGRDDGPEYERPAHRVEPEDFYIDAHEVTNGEYGTFLAWMRKTRDHRRCPPDEPADKDHEPAFWKDRTWNADDTPVVGVDWFDASAYAAWAGKRLPTEAEWEKAAGGGPATGGKRRYPWGDDYANGLCHTDPDRPARVGSHPEGRSPYGCCDMAGSVLEWSADLYRAYPGGRPEELFASEPRRVIRGGIWYDGDARAYARTTFRQGSYPDRRQERIGFRCAKTATREGDEALSR